MVGDRWVAAGVVIATVAVVGMGYFYFSVNSAREEAAVALEEAVQDSLRYRDIIERTQALQARQDSIRQKVAAIEEIDRGRYVWPHIFDEVATALPDYTWLTQIQAIGLSTDLRIAIRGRAGNNFALSVFMDQLELSPFLRGVDMISTTLGRNDETGQAVYSFDLEAQFQLPPMEELETVPLFGSPEADLDGVASEAPQQEPEPSGL